MGTVWNILMLFILFATNQRQTDLFPLWVDSCQLLKHKPFMSEGFIRIITDSMMHANAGSCRSCRIIQDHAGSWRVTPYNIKILFNSSLRYAINRLKNIYVVLITFSSFQTNYFVISFDVHHLLTFILWKWFSTNRNT